MYKMVIMVSALIMTGCAGKPQEELTSTALANTQWVLTGFETPVGVSTPPQRYFTLEFNSANELTGQLGCAGLKGEYTQMDTMLTIKSAQDAKQTTCVQQPQDSEFLLNLNAVKSYTRVNDALVLSLSDGRRLNFIKKFPGCSSPMATQNGVTERLEIVANNIPIDDLIAKYEKTRPDFVVLTAADACSKSVVVGVNPNTLLELRCDSTVAALMYK